MLLIGKGEVSRRTAPLARLASTSPHPHDHTPDPGGSGAEDALVSFAALDPTTKEIHTGCDRQFLRTGV